MTDFVFHFFANCKCVKGYNRSCLYDLQRGTIDYVPNDIGDFIAYAIGKTKAAILRYYSEDQETAESYLKLLVDKEYACFLPASKTEHFLNLDTKWDYPGYISNVHVENFVPNGNQLLLLEALGIHSMVFEFDQFPFDDPKKLMAFLNYFNKTRINNVIFLVKRYDSLSDDLLNILNTFPRVQSCFFYQAAKPEGLETEKLFFHETACQQRNQIIQPPNIPLYTEALMHHAYFNRKLYIGEGGVLKNAREIAETFGSLTEISSGYELVRLVSSERFQRFYAVNKDNCVVCSDCEYRYRCIDKRIPEETNENYTFETECDYNPYISRWKNETGYLNLENSGVTVQQGQLSIDEQYLAECNGKIWDFVD